MGFESNGRVDGSEDSDERIMVLVILIDRGLMVLLNLMVKSMNWSICQRKLWFW